MKCNRPIYLDHLYVDQSVVLYVWFVLQQHLSLAYIIFSNTSSIYVSKWIKSLLNSVLNLLNSLSKATIIIEYMYIMLKYSIKDPLSYIHIAVSDFPAKHHCFAAVVTFQVTHHLFYQLIVIRRCLYKRIYRQP